MKKSKMLERNYFMLKGPLKKRGYDWWWHNFTGINKNTGEERSFFIEYYICNPAIGDDLVHLGVERPSYGMIKCGSWGTGGKQIHNFYPITQVEHGEAPLKISLGPAKLQEDLLVGNCSLTEEEAKAHPEYMSDAGSMSWNLRLKKIIPFSVGYGASGFFRKINAFEMFWHVQGMKTEYTGEVIWEKEEYEITPEKSYGYADKNWGRDFTSPWLWLSSCNLVSRNTGKKLMNSAFDFGGGRPKIFGIPLQSKFLGCFVYEGTKYEYNFSKFWTGSSLECSFDESDENENFWKLSAKNRTSRLELEVSCPKKEMLFVNYEAPDGIKRHNHLWNGGTGKGNLKLYHTNGSEETLIDTFDFFNTGCEFGEYDKI